MGLESIIIAVHVVAAIAITALVLLQRGKGAEMGASFGSGASQTMFGSGGSGNFLTKSTTVMVIVFFATSLGLAVIAKQRADMAVQDNSLISGDIEQIGVESPGATGQADSGAGAQQEQPAGDLPVVEGGDSEAGGDLPQVDSGESGQ